MKENPLNQLFQWYISIELISSHTVCVFLINFACNEITNLSNFPDIEGASEALLEVRGEGADQLSDEVVALLRLEAEHEVGAGPVTRRDESIWCQSFENSPLIAHVSHVVDMKLLLHVHRSASKVEATIALYKLQYFLSTGKGGLKLFCKFPARARIHPTRLSWMLLGALVSA